MPLLKHTADRFMSAFHSTCTWGTARGVLLATAAPSPQILPEAGICAAIPGGWWQSYSYGYCFQLKVSIYFSLNRLDGSIKAALRGIV